MKTFNPTAVKRIRLITGEWLEVSQLRGESVIWPPSLTEMAPVFHVTLLDGSEHTYRADAVIAVDPGPDSFSEPQRRFASGPYMGDESNVPPSTFGVPSSRIGDLRERSLTPQPG